MLYLLHGENIAASRQALLDLKKNYSADSVSVFEAKSFDADEFVRACQTPSLLSDRRLIVVEGKIQQSALQLFSSSVIPSTTDVVFWTDEELKSSNKLLNLVRELGGQVRALKPTIPKHVFGFLDALGYKNKKKAFLELHRLLDQGESPLYLLTMMVWAARNWLNVKLQTPSAKKLNPFVRRKAESQVKNFEEKELVEIFHKLLDAEIKLKTLQIDPVLVLDRVVGKLTT